MLGCKVEKVPFGQRPSRGSFGQKPSNGTFGKSPSTPLKSKSLKQPLKQKPLKQSPLKMRNTPLKKKSKKSLPTHDEKEFMSWLHQHEQMNRYGCFVCGCNNSSDTLEWHHVKLDSTEKKNHFRQIPLCGNLHHRGTKTNSNIEAISVHGTPKKWRDTYSMKVQHEFAKKVHNDYLIYKMNSLYLEN